MNQIAPALSDEILEGAGPIAKFIFGETAHPRRARTAISRGAPHFKIGNRIFARRSTLLEWIADQERKSKR
jgi:hypothetical protein